LAGDGQVKADTSFSAFHARCLRAGTFISRGAEKLVRALLMPISHTENISRPFDFSLGSWSHRSCLAVFLEPWLLKLRNGREAGFDMMFRLKRGGCTVKGIWRVLVVMVCGALMALAALAGQVGYGDDYGRPSLRKAVADATGADREQTHDMTAIHLSHKSVEKL
jgi:hypothetical protein